jgi:DNA mismatch repair protein MutS2
VDAHGLAVLEFPAIVERLRAATESAYGGTLAGALLPSSDRAEVEERQALTSEAVALLDHAAEPSFAGLADVREAVARAAREGVLGPGELRQISLAVRIALEARRTLESAGERAPLLCERALRIELELAGLADSIARCVDDEGADLRDSASPKLRRLRAELRNGRQRVREEITRVARSPELREALQETFVTERGGRPVLAVKITARVKVPGVVHDSSSSGQTLFVEPLAVLELSNRLAEMASAERDEVERILKELSALVGASAAELETLVVATGELDLAIACGGLSRGWKGATVEISDEVRLLEARHPLIDARTAVPIDLDLDGLRVLVVSGPNTGGKTVALKTLGLAALLHQAGLRPPALEASLPVFDHVLADVGDEQSIEMSLSTFSAHLRNIVAILDAATERSLVLLDELAAGTDPVEGSALAQALLARLAHQARLTLVTTHYPELKEWASASDGVANAATEFDLDSHAPLYRIALGRPGTSHALHVAAGLGLAEGVVEDARGRIAPERLHVAELVAETEAAERQAAHELRAAGRARAEAERQAQRAREREAELEREIERVRISAADERRAAVAAAEQDLAAARAELAALRQEIRAARRRERERPISSADEPERDRRLGAAVERAVSAERALRALEPLPLNAPLAVGDPVQTADDGVHGTIASIEGETAEVLGPGGLRLRIPLSRLRPAPQRPASATPPEPSVHFFASSPADVPDELDVRGLRAQETREAVRSFVDAAALAGLESVRVIHGRGTGALRTAVREELASHKLIDRQQPDSANGATVAHLA